MIKDSVTIVRGCSGNCSFCAISRHQGARVVSRTTESIVREVQKISRAADFSGTISDLGGPTANLFGTSCVNPRPCKRYDCLYPQVCKFLQIDEERFVNLLHDVNAVQGVKKVFVSSGLRMELLLKTPKLIRELIRSHIPGVMKIAPEHTERAVLRLMHKPEVKVLEDFLIFCRKIARAEDKKLLFSPYVISAHPGCDEKDMAKLVKRFQKLALPLRQFQDFTPTPGTLSTAMFVAGRDRDTGKKIHVARTAGERRRQRLVLEKMLCSGRRKRG
jgi:uncharacterized radical SAM protein YgiQ